MTEYAHPVAAAIALVGLLLKLRDLRRDPGNPALRAICLVLGSLAGAVLVGWAPLYVGLDTLVGVPNLAKLLEHGLALTAAAAVQVLYLHLGDPATASRRARVRWLVLSAVLAVMVVMFWRADLDVETPHGFTDSYADDPHIVPYMLVYLSYLALAMADIFRTSTRYARHAPGRLLRVGIRLLAIGSVIGLAYVAHKAGFIVARRVDADPPWRESSGSRLLIVAGIAFVTSGLVLPSAGAAARDLARWPRRHRLHRRLHPLWRVVTEAVPEVVLYRPDDPSRDRLLLRGLRHALYRRVIEIHDGMLRLRPYADPADIAAARSAARTAGLDEGRVQAVADAAAIASAIRRRPTHPAVAAADPEADDQDADSANPESAARRLVAVAEAFRDSPIVAGVRRGAVDAARPDYAAP